MKTLHLLGFLLLATVASAQFFNDTFTDANGTNLQSHVPNSGGTWSKITTSGGGNLTLTIQSNTVQGATGTANSGVYFASQTPPAADYDVQASVTIGTNGDNAGVFVAARAGESAGAHTGYYFGTFGTNEVRLYSTAGGFLGTVSTTLTFGNTYVFKIRVNGTSIKCYVDGTELISVTNSDFTSAGQIGLWQWVGNSGTSFATDNMSASVLGGALDGGTATVTGRTDITASLTGTAASGGTAPYTYQWYRSTTNGFTPGGGNIISGATSQNLSSDTGLSPSTTYYYVRRTTDNAAATADTTQVSTTTYAGAAPNSAAITWSPYNWLTTSGSSKTINVGAYVKFQFSGTSLQALIDTSSLSSASPYPWIGVSIDNGPITVTQLTSATTYSIASSLASGTHTALIWYRGLKDYTIDRWTTPSACISFTRFLADAGATFSAVTPKTTKVLIYGDSITEGAETLTVSPTNQNETSWATVLGNQINAEFGLVACSAQGWRQVGFGNTPGLFKPADDTNSSWNKYWSGQTRLSSGLFSPAPTYIVSNMGKNDYGGSVSDANVQASVTGWLTAVRAAAPLAKIFLVIPFGDAGTKESAIRAGFADYQAATPDLKAYVVKASVSFAGVTTVGGDQLSTDGIHPTPLGDARIASDVAALIQAVISEKPGLMGL